MKTYKKTHALKEKIEAIPIVTNVIIGKMECADEWTAYADIRINAKGKGPRKALQNLLTKIMEITND